jgi:hypothetical protein
MVETLETSIRASTGLELAWVSSAPEEMQSQMKAQLGLHKEQELVQMLQATMRTICLWQRKELFDTEEHTRRERKRAARLH